MINVYVVNNSKLKKDHPSLLKAIAESFMLLKQAPKARNYLKKASELKWNPDDADDLEKCWLLSAASLLAVIFF